MIGTNLFDFFLANDWIIAIFVILLLVIVFVGLHYFLYDKIKKSPEENGNVSMYYRTAAVFYAVLLGFVVVTSWEHFESNVSNTQMEVNSLAALYAISNRFPAEAKEKMEKDIILYANLMIQEEWPAMQRREDSPKAFFYAQNIFDSIDEISPTNFSQANLQNQAYHIYNAFINARRTRLYENKESYPVLLLFTLFVGAFLILPITVFIHSDNKKRQLLLTGIISAFVGLLLSTFLLFERPYQGTMSISSTPWETLLQNIGKNYLSE